MLVLFLLFVAVVIGFKFLFSYFDDKMQTEWALSWSAMISLLAFIIIVRIATTLSIGLLMLGV